jgi:quinolinate synthase
MSVTPRDPRESIRAQKRRLGDQLVILAHHYQRDEIVDVADATGDSLELARQASSTKARWVVFCGVHFMAESADILRQPSQVVSMPHPSAGCPLADMATGAQMEEAYRALIGTGGPEPVVPVTYINSSAETKAFCGRTGGTVCTSSNARDAMAWALGQGGRVLFAPDRNLGLNTAHALGLPESEIAVWDPAAAGEQAGGGGLQRARVIVWNGYCHVHTYFTSEHVRRARQEYPGCRIVVHPECSPSVVGGVDASGSTGMIVRYVEESEPGSVIVIGTEIHLVRRLARKHPDMTILPLAPSECPDMARTTLWCLAATLDDLNGSRIVRVGDSLASDARQALERMLTIGVETQ